MPEAQNVGAVAFKLTTNRGAFTKEITSAANSAETIVKNTSQKTESIFKRQTQNVNKSLSSQAATLAAEYRKQGLSQSEAFTKAWSEIERNSKNSGAKIGKKFGFGFTKEMKSAAGSAESIVGSSMKKVGGFIASAFAVSKVVSFGKECVRVASETQSAWTGLNSILSGQGQSFNQANKFIKSYIKDGLVPLNNAVTAYKNLSARGYNTEQIEKVMTALKDSAAFSRQSSYSYGEAIQTATEGLKNENSILVNFVSPAREQFLAA